jgi:hypothetical protein
MVSAVVTDTSIAITYNEAVSCPSLAGAQADFAYYWTGAASGITSSSAVACVGDVLTLTGVFTLPGSTGGSITYTAPATNSSRHRCPPPATGLCGNADTRADAGSSSGHGVGVHDRDNNS